MSTAYSVPATHQLDGPILFGLDESSSTLAHPYIGLVRRANDGREFQLVYYQCSAEVQSTGQALVWVDTTAEYVVTSDTSDAGSVGQGFAGLATHAEADSDNIYEWIQVKGYADNVPVVNGVTANDDLYVGAAQLIGSIEDDFDSTSELYPRAIGQALTDDEASGGSSTCSIVIW